MPTISSNVAFRDLKCAKRQVRALLAKLRLRSEQGFIKLARQQQHAFLRSDKAKLVAADRAWKRLGRRVTLAGIIDLASRLNCWAVCREPVAFFDRPKRSGEVRRTFEFGPERVACQMMVQAALRACEIEVPSWQYERRGKGQTRAARAIVQAGNEGFHFAACLDIADCFSSFDEDRIIQILPLPEKVTRNTILSSGLGRACASVHEVRHTIVGGPQSHRALGLPQGSVASPLVASMLLSDLGLFVSDHCKLISFVDDFVILGRTKGDVDENSEALAEALYRHRSGRLRLRRHHHADWNEGFEFLGYRFAALEGSHFALPSLSNMKKWRRHFKDALCADLHMGCSSPQQTEAVLDAFAAAFPAWLQGPSNCREALEFAQTLIDRCTAYEFEECWTYANGSGA